MQHFSQYFQSTRDRMYQLSTAAAMVEVVTRVRAHRGYCRPKGMSASELLDIWTGNGGTRRQHLSGAWLWQRARVASRLQVPFAVVSYFEEQKAFAARRSRKPKGFGAIL